MGGMTRRDFLRAVALAGGGVALGTKPALAGMMGGGMGGGGMGGGGMGGGVIDPPVGAPFVDPVAMPATITYENGRRVVACSLEARRAAVDVNGVRANLLTYNGSSPGPTITARQGDWLRVHFHNALPGDGATNLLGHLKHETNLHTHGLHVSPGDNYDEMGAFRSHSDNMMVMTMPGDEEVLYEYDLSKHPAGNLNFYHPHRHGSVADQMWGGMAGALVIEDPTTLLSSFETHVMVVKDISLVGSEPAAHATMMDYMHGKEGDTVLVNGLVNPQLKIKRNGVQRWRIVNACTARFLRLALASHKLYLIGTEGGLLDKPHEVPELLVSPGERVDVLVVANQRAASYRFLSLPYGRMGNMGGQQVTLLTLTYSGSTTASRLPGAISSAARDTRDTSMLARERMELSMGMGAGYINGKTFTGHNDTSYMRMSTLGKWEVWDIVNLSGMDHPFHHHTNHAQVLSITGGDALYRSLWTTLPAWKDVTIVPKWGSVRLLVPVEDYTGMAMMHCHIIEHEDIGMMGMWHIKDESMPPMPM